MADALSSSTNSLVPYSARCDIGRSVLLATPLASSPPILPATLYEHWMKESAIPAMQQMAYGHLPVPVMSSEIKHAFSGAKLNLPAFRNQLRPNILET